MNEYLDVNYLKTLVWAGAAVGLMRHRYGWEAFGRFPKAMAISAVATMMALSAEILFVIAAGFLTVVTNGLVVMQWPHGDVWPFVSAYRVFIAEGFFWAVLVGIYLVWRDRVKEE